MTENRHMMILRESPKGDILRKSEASAVMVQFERLDDDNRRMVAKLIKTLFCEQEVKRAHLTLVSNLTPSNFGVFIGSAR